MSTTILPADPARAERNLRNHVRFGAPYVVQVYGQDVVDILDALDRARAAAVAALDMTDPASPMQLRAAAAGMRRG